MLTAGKDFLGKFVNGFFNFKSQDDELQTRSSWGVNRLYILIVLTRILISIGLMEKPPYSLFFVYCLLFIVFCFLSLNNTYRKQFEVSEIS